ncbi:MAG TPA: hypothetical protein VNX25_02415 [Verrucomicrobiae bacterium]|nr:hypothetical protein [Verrucomicrobiae bacterium]
MTTGEGRDTARAVSEIRELAGKLSSSDIEALETNLCALQKAIVRLRPSTTASAPTGAGAASPSIDDPDKVDRGPAVASDPSAI